MKLEIDGKTFEVSFRNDPSGHHFTIKHGNDVYTSKVRLLGTAGRLMAKKFHLTYNESMKLTDLIIDSYLIWRRKGLENGQT